MHPTAGYGLYVKMFSDFMEREVNRSLCSLGLTFSQHKVLMLLTHRPDHTATLKSVESEFHSAQSTVAGLAARLEKKGLVISLQDESDHRIKYIRITPEGSALCEKARQSIIAADERLVAPLSIEERAQLLCLFQRMYESMQEDTSFLHPNPSQKGRNQC